MDAALYHYQFKIKKLWGKFFFILNNLLKNIHIIIYEREIKRIIL
jgi:hypothetical protein